MTTRLFAYLIFGLIGMAAFGYGKKQGKPKAAFIGIAIMVYPYLVSDTLALWAIGAGLTTMLFMFRDR